uniref:Auxin-responsive protein n=1 Tax=Aegilops tauschii TaxID=37682 RepID=M8C8G3_AEGTA
MSTSSTNSAESPAVSGLDYDDTALTLALPGSSADDRKRALHDEHDKPPSPKARAVGWPPVRAYRRNALREEGACKLVKVAVDGAPYLRKVDLAAHGGMFVESCKRIRLMKSSEAVNLGHVQPCGCGQGTYHICTMVIAVETSGSGNLCVGQFGTEGNSAETQLIVQLKGPVALLNLRQVPLS